MPGSLRTWSFPLIVDEGVVLAAEITTILEIPVLENGLIDSTLPHSVAEVQLFLRPSIPSLEEVCNVSTGHIYTVVALFDKQGESSVLRAVMNRIATILTTYLTNQKDEYLSIEELLCALQRESETPLEIQKENLGAILMAHLPQLSNARLRLTVLLEMQQLMEAMASLTASTITFLRGLAGHMTNTIDPDELALDTHALKEVKQTREALGHIVDRCRESGILYTRYGIEKICEARSSFELLSFEVLFGKSLSVGAE